MNPLVVVPEALKMKQLSNKKALKMNQLSNKKALKMKQLSNKKALKMKKIFFQEDAEGESIVVVPEGAEDETIVE